MTFTGFLEVWTGAGGQYADAVSTWGRIQALALTAAASSGLRPEEVAGALLLGALAFLRREPFPQAIVWREFV